MGIYEKLGLKHIINASETYTNLGGSLMDSRTVAAMEEAARGFVDIPEMIECVGKRAAELTHNEAAHVTTGAAGGVVLSAVACMCGCDEEKLNLLPNTDDIQHRDILLYEGEYLNLIPYWKLIRYTGARIRLVKPNVQAMLDEVNERTAAVFLFPGRLYETGVPACEDTIPALKAKGVNVVVDAAAQLPPISNFWYYTRELGADLCIFSGGKHIRGPQSTGLIVGRRALIDAVRFSAAPNAQIGRPYKTGKEELAGFITALEIFVNEGNESLYQRQQLQLDRLEELLRLGGLNEIERLKEGRLGTFQPLMHVLLPAGKTAKACNAFARKMEQPVDIGFYGDEFGKAENLIFLNAYNLSDDELNAVANAVLAYVHAEEN